MDKFNTSVSFVRVAEGGYSNHKNDRGGATNYGVTNATFEEAQRAGIISKDIAKVKDITEQDAEKIFKEMYWNEINGDQLPQDLSVAVFDMAINSGPGRAAIELQKLVGVTPDGGIGPKTLSAIENYKGDLVADYLKAREAFFRGIVKSRPSQACFLKGWLNRNNNLRKYIAGLSPAGAAAEQTAASPPKEDSSNIYEVKSGDVLGKIAQEHGVPLQNILDANPGINPDLIKVGQKIAIPPSSSRRKKIKSNVLINGRTAVHAGSKGTLTTVDVCWTKIGKPVVPIPYTNIARSADAAKTASTVFINGNPVCHQKSIFAVSTGDEPGNRKGIRSGTIIQKAEFVTGSSNVFIEGVPAARQADLMVSNNANTAPMPLAQPGAPPARNLKPKKAEELEATELPNEVPLTVSGGKLHMQHDLVGYNINAGGCNPQTIKQQQKSEPPEKAVLSEPGKAKPVLTTDEQKPTIKEGQITFDAEGNDIPSSPYFSRMIHWPGNALSGVTLGRGYDMGSRSESEIYNHMVAAGVDTTQASKISQAHGLKGNKAQQFVTTNKKSIGEISRDQQIMLFNLTYPDYVNRAIANYNSWTSDEPGRMEWSGLKQVIKDVLVDFVYQGFTKGPNPMKAGMKNDVNELISYIENTPAISQYEDGRHRADYLRNNK